MQVLKRDTEHRDDRGRFHDVKKDSCRLAPGASSSVWTMSPTPVTAHDDRGTFRHAASSKPSTWSSTCPHVANGLAGEAHGEAAIVLLRSGDSGKLGKLDRGGHAHGDARGGPELQGGREPGFEYQQVRLGLEVRLKTSNPMVILSFPPDGRSD